MSWEKIAELFDIEPGVMREAADIESAKSKKEVFPEDVLIYEICETYPEWTRMRILVPYICSFNKDEFAYVLLLGRRPIARILLFKARADCGIDKGAELTLEEFLYGNPLLTEEEGTVIQRTGFIRYWIEESDKKAIESLTIIGYTKEEAEEMVKKVKGATGVVPKTEEEKKPPTKEDVLADIKKRMEKYK